ncbi:diguanylate cyclase [bacterium]|nr:diguanylate cyclase [bacterium]
MNEKTIQRTEKILVVDDELCKRETLAELAGALGFTVNAFSDWISALLELRRTRYDLLICNLFLNGVSGIDILREVKALSPSTAVIIATSSASIENAIECIREGAYDYLVTPFTVGTLEVSINRSLEHRRLLKESQEKELYKKLATQDGLTKVNNYTFFRQFLGLELEKCLRYDYPVTLLMIDVDDLKSYNDNQGHMEGNRALKKIGEILKGFVRKADVAARYGGDEFAVIFSHTTKEKGAAVGERLRRLVQETDFKGERTLPGKNMTISIGVAACPEDAVSPEELISRADQALYEAKSKGKNDVSVYRQDAKNSAEGSS